MEEEGEEEFSEEEDRGIGGSSPIPSVHHSFKEDNTLQEIPEDFIQDKFSQENEDFISVVEEFQTLSSSLDTMKSLDKSVGEERKEINQTLKNLHQLNQKVNKL